MESSILAKIMDICIDHIISFFIYTLKLISPVKLSPKQIPGTEVPEGWREILDIKIENRLNHNLFNLLIAGISKDEFDVKILSDDGPKEKTVEHMDLNTNHMVIYATDKRNGNNLWIFRIQKLGPKTMVNLKVKVSNKSNIYFKTMQYSKIESPIKERDDGVVMIPFEVRNVPVIYSL